MPQPQRWEKTTKVATPSRLKREWYKKEEMAISAVCYAEDITGSKRSFRLRIYGVINGHINERCPWNSG